MIHPAKYLTLFFSSIFIAPCFAQTTETIQIDTYYPSPYGVYAELTTTSNTYLATEGGTVGIGTTSPDSSSKLYIEAKDSNAFYVHGNQNSAIGAYLYNEGGSVDINIVSNDNDWAIRAAGSGTSNPGELLFKDVSLGTNAMVIVDGTNRVGIGIDDPQAKLDVSGTIYADGIGNAGTKVWRGVNTLDSPSWGDRWLWCNDDEIMTGFYYNPNTWNTRIQCKKWRYVSYTAADCTGASGTLVYDGAGVQFCKFSGSSCPGGWSQYNNWSTTQNEKCDDCGGIYSCCYTDWINSGSHGWADSPVENSPYTWQGWSGGSPCVSESRSCQASVSYVGCY